MSHRTEIPAPHTSDLPAIPGGVTSPFTRINMGTSAKLNHGTLCCKYRAIQILNTFTASLSSAGIFNNTRTPSTGLVTEQRLTAEYPVATALINNFGGLAPYTSNHNNEWRLHTSLDGKGAHRHSGVRVTEVGCCGAPFTRPSTVRAPLHSPTLIRSGTFPLHIFRCLSVIRLG